MRNIRMEESVEESQLQLLEELDYIKLLQNMSTELIWENNIQILFEKIMDIAIQIMKSDFSSIHMLHEDNDKLELLAFRGFNEKAAKFWEYVYIEDARSFCGESLRRGGRIIVPNVNECEFIKGSEDLDIYLNTGINSVQSTPLYSRSGKMLGMISTHWRKPHQPSDRELRLFDLLARQAADLIQQKKSEEKLRESEKRYRELFEFTSDGFFLGKVIYDQENKPIDYSYLAVNPTFETITGLKREDIVGKSSLELWSSNRINVIEDFNLVATTGIPTSFERHFEPLDSYFLFKVFSPKSGLFACLIQDITERKKAENKMKWEKDKAEILYEVTDKLLASTNPQEIIDELCIKVMKFLKCDVYINYLIDEVYGKLFINSCSGIPEETIRDMQWLDFETAICGCVASTGKRIIAENIQISTDSRLDIARSFGLKAQVCHPLMCRNKVIGTLSFGTRLKGIFNEDEIALLKDVSEHVSIALSRIRTEQMLRRQQEMLIQAESEKREALEKAMDMKDEFLSLVSHELRTPINVINTAVQALNSIYADEMSDKVKKYIRIIRQNTFRQLRLVNNLLDITRANAGLININKNNIDIVFLTKAITESVYQFANQKGVELTFVTSVDQEIIGIDEEKYERIILNLLSNAIKFTPKGKAVKVSVHSSIDNIKVDIEDEGVGIPESKLELIFERFGQVDNSLSRQAEGAGIGLSLVKNFVEALDGSIAVKSKLGVGSTFTMLLPNKQVIEERHEKQMIDLLDNRLVHVTNVEFSDIYL
ncbi:GAF domain-containing protein [Serpentinicella alkaliphila]|uniref:histidine kinase n=1 Tax=Serpentinicella alkaliphila TaxID=1734049 RepID=A0A4R2TLN0_9FIRM|nr:GAF domain-containing protein [Serpentinicella alkaliphila]QUH24751.1 GAF domain-containing protein [Serpentinicella alkaliphila]TCQ03746.1 PAS domain S-box-containing protein [Serpentinicella alkaliphila]